MEAPARLPTLAEMGLETIALLKQVKNIDKPAENMITEEWPRGLFAAEADRFDLWAVNLGLFVSGHGSLDYRLRDAERLESTIRKFIKDLNSSLNEVLEYCSGEYGELTNEGQNDSASRPFSDFLEANPEDEDGGEQESDIDLLLDSVRDPIDRLFKVSTRIRNPSSRLGSSKALRHEQIDPDSKIDLLRAVEAFDHDHVSSLFLQYRKSKALEEQDTVEPPGDTDGKDEANNVWEPIRTVLSQYHNDISNGTESFLVRRIARANVRRRQQFSYWKQHRDKLARHTKSFTLNIETRGKEAPTLVNFEKQGNELLIPGMAIAQSVTTATHLSTPQLVDQDNRSTVSISEYAPSVWKPGKEVVDFPQAPKRDLDEKFFECPYCFTLCSTETLAEKAWKAHLIHDLRPYICTYKDCRNPDQLYDSRQDWIQHENYHRKIWCCPEHPSHTSTSLDEYRSHLRQDHREYDDETLRNSLIQAAETALQSADRSCPICSLQLDTARSLQSHIALHLERFALFSLPRSIGQETEDSDNGDSDKPNTAFEGSRDQDFDSDASVEGENDQTASAAHIARERWKRAIHTLIKQERLAHILSRGAAGSSSEPISKRRARFYDRAEVAYALARALRGDKRSPDTVTLIEILPGLTHEQVMDLRVEYKKIVKTGSERRGVNIAKHIKMRLKEEDPSLMNACYACALGQWESEAYWVNYWYQSEKSRRELLIESLMGRTNQEIREIKNNFSDKKYNNSLIRCMKTELKEDKFKKAILLALDEIKMEELTFGHSLDNDLLEDDVRNLRKAVSSEKGGETVMIDIIIVRSDTHMREVLKLYESTYKENFAREMLKKSGNLIGELLAHILNGVINKPVRDAVLVHHALTLSELNSIGTVLLISRLVRYHWDHLHMEAVKRAYHDRYGMEMQQAVADGTRGDWGHFCEMLCQNRLIL